MVTTPVYFALLGAFALERLRELGRSRRNAANLRARGAVERGRRHYPAMVAMHALLFVCCVAERLMLRRQAPAPVAYAALIGLGGAYALRRSAVRALGDRWTTRILVLPDAPLVTGGPYRHLRHPNYVAVAIEVAAVPLAGGCVLTAVAFSAINALVLAIRIRAEERALGLTHARA